MLPAAPSAMATARNMPFRVAARLPERDAACATGGGRQAACAGCISSSSTRRRSAPSSHLHLSRLWTLLSLFVCVSAQVMYGASATSGHFGGVVLWRLDPLAAGEVLIRAGEHPRLLYGALMIMLYYHIVHSISTHQHLPTRITTPAQIQMPALMAVRQGAGGALVLAA